MTDTKHPDKTCYPHACPKCGQPAFLGLTKAQCSNGNCEHHEERFETRKGVAYDADVVLSKSTCSRIKRLHVGRESMAQIFSRAHTGHFYEVVANLPPDAHVVSIRQDHAFCGYTLLIESSEYEALPACAEIPLIQYDWTEVKNE